MIWDKQSLRSDALKKREGTSIIEIAELSARISLKALSLPQYIAAERVFCYGSFKSEVGTHALLRQILADGKALYLPVIREDRRLDAVRIYRMDELSPNTLRIPEPMGKEAIDPGELDVLFLPGVAFDRRGGRVGYGAGYIDRFLEKCTGTFAGLAYEIQMYDEVPMAEHDRRMHYIVTEKAIYDCGLEGEQ